MWDNSNNMEVYVVESGYDYEESFILGIYDSYAKALDIIELNIDETFTVDGNYWHGRGGVEYYCIVKHIIE